MAHIIRIVDHTKSSGTLDGVNLIGPFAVSFERDIELDRLLNILGNENYALGGCEISPEPGVNSVISPAESSLISTVEDFKEIFCNSAL